MPINVLHMVPDLMELNYTLVVNTKKDVIKITVKKTDVYNKSHIFEGFVRNHFTWTETLLGE